MKKSLPILLMASVLASTAHFSTYPAAVATEVVNRAAFAAAGAPGWIAGSYLWLGSHVVSCAAYRLLGLNISPVSLSSAAKVGAAVNLSHTLIQDAAHVAHQYKEKVTLDEPVLPDNAPVVVLLCHGFGGSSKAMQAYPEYSKLPIKMVALDFPSSTLKTNDPLMKAHFAQKGNIDCIIKNYLELVKQGNKVILWGVSDGAASLTTALGTHAFKNVKKLILESPYADVEKVVANFIYVNGPLLQQAARNLRGPKIIKLGVKLGTAAAGTITSLPCAPGVLAKGTTLLGKIISKIPYCPYGIRPIDVAHKIQNDVPVLVIASKGDKLIPWWHTAAVYKAMVKAQHPKTRLIVLDRGEHANLLWGAQGATYYKAVWNFLKEETDQSAGKIRAKL